jgi:4-amino-4-deoxy-L-arabinose transferase-like glycosyltransferase
MKFSHIRLHPWFVVILGLVMMASALLWSAWDDSQTIDEAVHLSAGYSALRTGDFRINPEHPPLIKLLSGIPLLPLGLNLPTDHPSWESRDQWEFGRQLLYHNSVSSNTILFAGRLANILLTLALVLAVTLVARRLFGWTGAFLTLAVAVFDPTLIAHGHLVTTDVGVALFFFLTILSFARFLQSGRRTDLLVFLAIFAAAQLAKFSAVTLFPIIILLRLIWAWQQGESWSVAVKSSLKIFGQTVLATFIGAFLLYGFSFQRIGDDPRIAQLYQDRARIVETNTIAEQAPLTRILIRLTDPDTAIGQRILWTVDHVRVPLYPFFRGLAAVYSHNYGGHLSYLMGQYSNLGWWYYFPVAFAVKTPGGTLILAFLLAILASRIFSERLKSMSGPSLRRWTGNLKTLPFSVYWLFIPPAFYFLTSLTSHINLGIRHLTPVYPFLFVGIGWLATVRLTRFTRAFRTIIVSIVVLIALETAVIAPHFLAYFNGFSGGPRNGPRYLVDSNIDWGQDLDRLGQYLKQRGIQSVALAYFGTAEIGPVVPNRIHLPTKDETDQIRAFRGVAAISVTALLSRDRAYEWLRPLTPTDTIGYSIFVYDLR